MSSSLSKTAQKVAANSTFGSLSNAAPKNGWQKWFKTFYDDERSKKVMPYKAAHAELIKRKKNKPHADHKLVKVNAGQFYVKTTFKPLVFLENHIDQTSMENYMMVDYVGLLKDKPSIYDPTELTKLYGDIRGSGKTIYHSIKSRTGTVPYLEPHKYIFDTEAGFGLFSEELNAEAEQATPIQEELGGPVAEGEEGSL